MYTTIPSKLTTLKTFTTPSTLMTLEHTNNTKSKMHFTLSRRSTHREPSSTLETPIRCNTIETPRRHSAIGTSSQHRTIKTPSRYNAIKTHNTHRRLGTLSTFKWNV